MRSTVFRAHLAMMAFPTIHQTKRWRAIPRPFLLRHRSARLTMKCLRKTVRVDQVSMHRSLRSLHHWPMDDTLLSLFQNPFQPQCLILPLAAQHSATLDPIFPLTIRGLLSKVAVQPRTPIFREGRTASSCSHGRSESVFWQSSRVHPVNMDQASLKPGARVRKNFLRMRPGNRRLVENTLRIFRRGEVFLESYPRVMYTDYCAWYPLGRCSDCVI